MNLPSKAPLSSNQITRRAERINYLKHKYTAAEIFERIKRLLKEKEMTQNQLTGPLGLKKSAVSQKLNGHRPTGIEEIIIIAKTLNVSLSELCEDNIVLTQTRENDSSYANSRAEKRTLKLIRSLSESDRIIAIRVLEGLSGN